MSLFSRKKTLEQSGFFKGNTDYHSHILPGVDDGFATMEESLAILAKYEKTGISDIWLTPHIMEDMPNSTQKLKFRFEEFSEAYSKDHQSRGVETPEITLHLASENMLDGMILSRLEKNDFLPMLGNKLLIETSYYNPPVNFYGLIDKIKSAGYFPVLAHPERYIYMGDDDFATLQARGVIFQLNLFSVLGYYGTTARMKAEHLLKNSCYSLIGTDLHKEKIFDSAMAEKISDKTLDMLKKICF